MTHIRLTDRQISTLAEIITKGGSVYVTEIDRAGRRILDQLATKNLVRYLHNDEYPERYCLTPNGKKIASGINELINEIRTAQATSA